jgi:ribosomal protein S18 acetylase RimI-like enzyme
MIWFVLTTGAPLSPPVACMAQGAFIKSAWVGFSARNCSRGKVWKGTLASARCTWEQSVYAPGKGRVAERSFAAAPTTAASVRVEQARTSRDAWKAAQVYALSFYGDSKRKAKLAGGPALPRNEASWTTFGDRQRDWALQVLALEAWFGFCLRMACRPRDHRLYLAWYGDTTSTGPASRLSAGQSATTETVVGLVELSLEPVRFQITTLTAALLDSLGSVIRSKVFGLDLEKTYRLWPVRRVYLYNLATHPDYRRRGIAQQLLTQCEQQTRVWRHNALYLHVERENAGALRLYQRAGYRAIAAEAQRRPSGAPCLLGKWVSRRAFLPKHRDRI